ASRLCKAEGAGLSAPLRGRLAVGRESGLASGRQPPVTPSVVARIRREWPLATSLVTTVVFLALGDRWLADLGSVAWFSLMLGWLFGAILVSAFAVVRHAEALAEQVHEPLGTLVLTLSMSGMEMMMITAVMYAGRGESSLARDTMLAIVMIVLKGLVAGSPCSAGSAITRRSTTSTARMPFWR